MKDAIDKLKQNIANGNYIVPVWAQQELVDELKQLEKFKDFVYRIASFRYTDEQSLMGAKQIIADYEDHQFMNAASRDLFEQIEKEENS